KSDLDVIGLNKRGPHRICLVCFRGPVLVRDYRLLQLRGYAIGESVVEIAQDERGYCREHENKKRGKYIGKRLSKHRRRFISIKREEYAKPRRLAAINRAVRSPDQVIEVIHQALVPHLFASYSQVGRRSPVEAAEFAHLFAGKVFQAIPGHARGQL